MGALLGLALSAGVLLVWWSLSDDRTTRSRLRISGSVGGRLRELTARAGLGATSPAAVLGLCAVCAFIAGTIMLGVSRTVPVALAFAAIGAGVPIVAIRSRARRRQAELAAVWPEAVDHLASAVRAGLSLPEALTKLGERGPEPLRQPFTDFGHDYLATGRFVTCLDRLQIRLADPVGDRVTEALRLAREVGGGDLGRLLRTLSSFLREEARTRAELESRQAWTINGARLAAAAPWLVLVMLSFQPEVVSRYSSTAGVVVLVGGALACAAAYWAMLRIGRLPVERRVLR